MSRWLLLKNRIDKDVPGSREQVAYLTIYSGKARTNKIFVAVNDGDTYQLEDFIQILQQVLAEIKEENSAQQPPKKESPSASK